MLQQLHNVVDLIDFVQITIQQVHIDYYYLLYMDQLHTIHMVDLTILLYYLYLINIMMHQLFDNMVEELNRLMMQFHSHLDYIDSYVQITIKKVHIDYDY
eukprot:361225_1